jgi:hypothetical protein
MGIERIMVRRKIAAERTLKSHIDEVSTRAGVEARPD